MGQASNLIDLRRSRHAFSRLTPLVVVLLVTVHIGASTAMAVDVRTVTLTGATAPGTQLEFFQLSAPVINNSNVVAFTGLVANGPTNTSGLWSEGLGALANVGLEGQPAPGTALNFGEFDDPNTQIYLNNNGQAAVELRLSDFNHAAIFSQTGAGNALRKVALGGDPAPGATDPNRVFQPFLGPIGGFNDAGQSAFQSGMPPTAVPPGNFPSTGVWSEGSGSLTRIAEAAMAAPGGGVFAANVDFAAPAINGAGSVAFVGTTSNGAAEAVYTNLSGSLARVVGTGNAAPGGGTFSSIFHSTVALNDAGNIAFSAALNVTVADGIWVVRNGGIQKVAVEGDVAPGGGGAVFGAGSPGINTGFIGLDAAGDAAFYATLSNAQRGLFSEGLGGLHGVGLSGTVAPDTGGLLFQNVIDWTINSAGQTAFIAQLSDSSHAIFAEDANGVLHEIVGEGQMLEVAPGDFRQIVVLNFQGINGSSSRFGNNTASGFSADGHTGFFATFADGSSGVFVTALPVPEPATWTLIALGAAMLVGRRPWTKVRALLRA